MAIEIYKSLETPVSWKASVHGVILTAGITNNVSLKIKDTPASADSTLSAGYIDLSVCDITDISTKHLEVIDTAITSGSSDVTVSITLPDNFRRGYYKLHIVHKDSNKNAIGVYSLYAVVDKAVNPIKDMHMEIEGVRNAFADIYEEDNKLLDSLEVSVGDICSAVQRCLEQWISVAPRTSSYTGYDFPYPELLRNGTLCHLLSALITYLGRSRMQYNAGGTSVDLESRMDFYRSLKQEYEGAWRSGMAQMKAEENMMSFNGHLHY